MSAGPLPQVAIARKIGVGAAHRLRHRGRTLGRGVEVNVIRHQAVGLNRETLIYTVVPEQIHVKDVVSIFKEDTLATVAALCNVVEDALQNDAGDSWHTN